LHPNGSARHGDLGSNSIWWFADVLSCRVVGSQQLFLAGLQLTSPLMAAVSQNMIPVFTFLLAAALGYARSTFSSSTPVPVSTS
jgi:drug/metabolite transporter (DMT)-like permease